MKDTEYISEVKIVNNIKLTVPDDKKLFNRAVVIIVAALGLFGTVFSFFSTYKTDISSFFLFYVTAIYFCIFTFILMLPRKFHLIIIPAIALWGFLLYKKFEEFIVGFKIIANDVYKCIYPKSGSYFRIKSENTENAEIFLAFILLVFTLFICYFLYCQPNFFISFMLTFGILEIGLFFGKSPKLIFVFMLLLYWVALAALKYCGYIQKEALNGWDPTYGALYFWNPYKPVNKWMWTRTITVQYGDHVFAR